MRGMRLDSSSRQKVEDGLASNFVIMLGGTIASYAMFNYDDMYLAERISESSIICRRRIAEACSRPASQLSSLLGPLLRLLGMDDVAGVRANGETSIVVKTSRYSCQTAKEHGEISVH